MEILLRKIQVCHSIVSLKNQAREHFGYAYSNFVRRTFSPNSRVCARHFPEGNEQPPTQSRYSMHLVWFAELSAWNITRAKSHFLYSVHFTNPTSKTASISATTPCRSFIRSSTDVPLSEVLHQSCKTRTYGHTLTTSRCFMRTSARFSNALHTFSLATTAPSRDVTRN